MLVLFHAICFILTDTRPNIIPLHYRMIAVPKYSIIIY